MDAVITSVYGQLLRHHGASVDAVLEDPELRNTYLAEVRRVVGDLPERTLLHRLTCLRKKSKLPRRVDLDDTTPSLLTHDTTTPTA